MKYYVYELINSLNSTVFYVGKGTGNRLYKHLQIAVGDSKNKKRNPKLYNKINNILQNGGTVLFKKILETDDENEALRFEVERIAAIGLENLTNLTVGGEGTSFPNGFTQEHKKHISLSKKGKTYAHMFKPSSEQKKRNISIALKRLALSGTHDGYWKDKRLSDETKSKMSLSHKGKLFSRQHRESLSKSLTGSQNKLGYQTPVVTKDKISSSLKDHYKGADGDRTRKILSDLGKSQLVNGKRVLSLEARRKMSEGAKRRNGQKT